MNAKKDQWYKQKQTFNLKVSERDAHLVYNL